MAKKVVEDPHSILSQMLFLTVSLKCRIPHENVIQKIQEIANEQV